uniref:Uncharacterized protein n=1 Tax=Myotis myotis TaxID=51298 RepID=A0A7J7VZF7_MYOMY|nr:hypothetical protein mMyoMyo1_012370 [Myotis myotis]
MGGVLRQPQGPGRTPRSLLDHFASGPTLSSLRPDLLGGVGGEGNERTTCAWDLGGTLRSEQTQPPAHGFQADGQVLGSLGPGPFPRAGVARPSGDKVILASMVAWAPNHSRVGYPVCKHAARSRGGHGLRLIAPGSGCPPW